jgi:hypothetical protein
VAQWKDRARGRVLTFNNGTLKDGVDLMERWCVLNKPI